MNSSRRPATCCSPWSTSPGMSVPTRIRRCAAPMPNSSAASDISSEGCRRRDARCRTRRSPKWTRCGMKQSAENSFDTVAGRSQGVRHRVEAVDDDVTLGLVDPDGHVEATVVKLLVEYFRVAMQPTDAGAIGRVNRQNQRHARGRKAIFDRTKQCLDALPGCG